MTERFGWRWLPCGCVVCYQISGWPNSPSEQCAEAAALHAAVVASDEQPPYHPDRRAMWIDYVRHYGVPLEDIDRRWPKYGWTPYGRPIYSTDDPDHGRERCRCGLVWASEHAETGCPPRLITRPCRCGQAWAEDHRGECPPAPDNPRKDKP